MGSECQECGMICEPGEYHPYAACLMFKACHNGATVRANLPAKQAGVTEAMVEAALCAWYGPDDPGPHAEPWQIKQMRAALLAAIGAEGQPDPQEGR